MSFIYKLLLQRWISKSIFPLKFCDRDPMVLLDLQKDGLAGLVYLRSHVMRRKRKLDLVKIPIEEGIHKFDQQVTIEIKTVIGRVLRL